MYFFASQAACQDGFQPDTVCCRMPPKKWTVVLQNDEPVVEGKVAVGDDIKDICDFRDAAMEVRAFQAYLQPHAANLKICVKHEELQELDMRDSVSALENFGNDPSAPILIVLPAVPGELC